MRISVLMPNWGFLSGNRTLHRYSELFIEKYCERKLSYEEAKEYDGDVEIMFNGRPDLFNHCPPKEFKGVKIVHLLDHVFQAEESRRKLLENKVDYVMCYNRHDKYDEFFKYAYPEYINKVIPVPFGYNDLRFKQTKPFEERINKVVALGSVNPVNDPLCSDDIRQFVEFFKDEQWTHKWRRSLYVHSADLTKEMDSLLPSFPVTKDFNYDIVETYNKYKMFTSCESIMRYPSVKTFEGVSCGSVLVCSDHPCYADIGFIDGLNCIMHKDNDIKDFQRVVRKYQQEPELLKIISEAGKKHVEKNYNPQIIADRLYNKIHKLWTAQF